MGLAAIRQDRCGIPFSRWRRLAAGHSCCDSSPGAEQPHHLIAFLRVEVQRCEVGVTLRRRYDPALMRSPERLGVARISLEGIAGVIVLNEGPGNTRSSRAHARRGRQCGRSLHQTTPSRARPFAASAVHQRPALEIRRVGDGDREVLVCFACGPADVVDCLQLRFGARHVTFDEIRLPQVFADLHVVRIERY